MEKKQSSVDFYRIESQKLMVKALRNQISIDEWRLLENELGDQAKSMHKEEVTDAYIECWMNDGGNGFHKVKEAEQYYNETFGGENEQ